MAICRACSACASAAESAGAFCASAPTAIARLRTAASVAIEIPGDRIGLLSFSRTGRGHFGRQYRVILLVHGHWQSKCFTRQTSDAAKREQPSNSTASGAPGVASWQPAPAGTAESMERLPDKELLNKSVPLEKGPGVLFIVRWRLRGSRLLVPLEHFRQLRVGQSLAAVHLRSQSLVAQLRLPFKVIQLHRQRL